MRSKENKRKIISIMVIGSLFPSLVPKTADAVTPTISVTEESYDAASNTVNIRIDSNGVITLPGGVKKTGQATYTAVKNGVYSFEAKVDGQIVHESIHVTKINSEKIRTKNPSVSLNVQYKDELSGIQYMRFKNDTSLSWNPWQTTSTTNGTQSISWNLDTSTEGNKTIYAQFQDKAGNITPGEAYDNVVYDISGPTFNIGYEKYYVRENTFKLNVSDLTDLYSPVDKVSIKVGNQPYKDYDMTAQFIQDLNSGLDVEIPDAERLTPGKKTVYVKAQDDLGNVSEIKTTEIFYDNIAPNKGDITLNDKENNQVKVVEGGRQWNGSEGEYIYFEKEDNIRLMDDRNIRIQLDMGDKDSGVKPDFSKNGFARVDIIEYNVTTNADRNVISGSKQEVGRKTLRTEIKPDGSLNIPWTLTYGLEKQIEIIVYDNAGNSRLFRDDPFYMSALSLVHFNLQDVVNPQNKWHPVDFSGNSESAEMMAGGNVDFEIMYGLLTAKAPERIHGSVEFVIKDPDGTKIDTQIITLDSSNHEAPVFKDTFTIPQETPVGSKVYANGWIKAEFTDNDPLIVYFPTKDVIVEREIGVITGNLHEEIQFQTIR